MKGHKCVHRPLHLYGILLHPEYHECGEYSDKTSREVKAKLAGMNRPFDVEMGIEYWKKDNYLKLDVSVKELGHTVASGHIHENFAAGTHANIFKMLDQVGKNVKEKAKTEELDTKDFDAQLKVALEDCMHELMAMM